MLEHRKEKLETTRKGCQNLWRLLKPFKFILGAFFFLVSVLIIVSFILTNIDRIVNSPCGAKCGYILNDPKKWNPIDSLLVVLSEYFPLDYILMGLLILYIYFCTLAGLVNIGIRLIWIKLFKVKPHGTQMQGLLLGTVVVMFSLLALNIELMSLAPQYVAYGDQTYILDGDKRRCELSSPTSQCTMTQIGTIINRIALKLTFFGVIFYYATWAFVGFFLYWFDYCVD